MTHATPRRAAARADRNGWPARKRLAAALVCAGLLLGPLARAEQLSLFAGGDAGYHNVTLAWQGDPLWQRTFGSSRLDLVLEASAGRAFGPAGQPGAPLWHVGLTPIARWWFLPDTALEAGIGANLFSATRIGSKRISTAYQFGDSIGLYHRLAGTSWGLGVRFTHYSNADIKRPNPGQNYLQLRISHEFH